MTQMRICMAGATGWTGRAITEAILEAEDLVLTAAVSRKAAGLDVALAIGRAETCGVTCVGSVEAALATCDFDILIDYTTPEAVKDHTLHALAAGKHVIIGTSGLTAVDFAEIEKEAERVGVGVVASGNFALTAALMARFSLMAAEYLDHFEILDFGKPTKPDAPSGTARELAERMGEVKKPVLGHPLNQIIGERELRGGTINGVQVHSLRLPSYSASVTAEFAVPGSRLTLTHDAGTDASIYAEGTLLAARKVSRITGLVRGLDNLLD